MNIAVILPELDSRSGGGFTFQRALLDTLLAVEPETNHRFIYYGKGPVDVASDRYVRLKLGRGAVLARRLTQLVRDAQDRTLGTRPWFGGHLLVSRAQTVFDASGNLTDETIKKQLQDFLAGFVKAIQGNT